MKKKMYVSPCMECTGIEFHDMMLTNSETTSDPGGKLPPNDNDNDFDFDIEFLTSSLELSL